MIKFGKNGKEVPTIDFSNASMYIKSASHYGANLTDTEAVISFYIKSDDYKKMDRNDIITQLNFFIVANIGQVFFQSLDMATIDLDQRSSKGNKPVQAKFFLKNIILMIALGVNSNEYGMHTKVNLKDLNPDEVLGKMQNIQQLINNAAIKYEELSIALHNEYNELNETISKQDLWKQKYMENWVEYCKINLESQGIAWHKVRDLAENKIPDLLN